MSDAIGYASGAPDWRTFKGGTRRRVALWLVKEVGAGGVFSKADLRAAFPGIEQIDRRMRDLRQDGWSIATYREDRSLAQDQLRLLTIGGNVWEKNYVSQTVNAVTDKQRSETLAADGYVCRTCGIAAGEPYPEDSLRTAKLAAERYHADSGKTLLRTLCDRCLTGGKPNSSSTDLIEEIDDLDAQSMRKFIGWVDSGRRDISHLDQIWGKYLSLPHELRSHIAEELKGRDER